MDLKKKRVLDWGRAVDATERGSSNWGHSHLHPKANAGLFRSGEQAGIMVARNYEEYVRDGKRGRRANRDGHITERRRNLWGSKVQEDDYGWHQLIAHIKLPIMNVPKSKNLNISVVGQFSWLFNHYTLHYKYWNGMLCHLKIYTFVSQLKMKSLFPKSAFRVLEAWGQFSASLSYKLGEPIWVIPILVSAEYNYRKSRAYSDGMEMRVVIWPRKYQSQKQQSCLSKVSVPTQPGLPNCQTGGCTIFSSWFQRKPSLPGFPERYLFSFLTGVLW